MTSPPHMRFDNTSVEHTTRRRDIRKRSVLGAMGILAVCITIIGGYDHALRNILSAWPAIQALLPLFALLVGTICVCVLVWWLVEIARIPRICRVHSIC